MIGATDELTTLYACTFLSVTSFMYYSRAPYSKVFFKVSSALNHLVGIIGVIYFMIRLFNEVFLDWQTTEIVGVAVRHVWRLAYSITLPMIALDLSQAKHSCLLTYVLLGVPLLCHITHMLNIKQYWDDLLPWTHLLSLVTLVLSKVRYYFLPVVILLSVSHFIVSPYDGVNVSFAWIGRWSVLMGLIFCCMSLTAMKTKKTQVSSK